MADRSAARILGKVFQILAKQPEINRDVAHELFDAMEDYDFSVSQMEANHSLMALGLARPGTEEEKEEECYPYLIIYKNDSRF